MAQATFLFSCKFQCFTRPKAVGIKCVQNFNVLKNKERDTIARDVNHYWSAESLQGGRKVPTQVLSSMQYICFRKTSGSNIERLASCPGCHLTSLCSCFLDRGTDASQQ